MSTIGYALRGVWIGIDLGTQSVKAMAVSDAGEILASASHPLSSQRSGREHTQDPSAWWEATAFCCRQITRDIHPAAIRGLAIDATSGTILLTDDQLRPASEALMYDDGRAVDEAAAVALAGEALWNELGYRIQPSWALPKLLWLARTQPRSGMRTLQVSHQNDFIHQQLAGKRVATDWSHSLKTGFDLLRLRWPLEVFERLELPATLFPEVVAPGSLLADVCSKAASETGLPEGLPIFAGMTDGCAAQIASGTVDAGSWNSVIGTTLVLKGVTPERVRDPLGVVYSHLSREGTWLPGGASSTGAGMLTRELPGADLEAFSLEAAKRGPSSLVLYPLAAPGERFPFHAPGAHGFSLGAAKDNVDLYCAIIEGISFLERLSFDYMGMLGAPLYGTFTISGGAVRSDFWNRLRATVLERTLTVPSVTESAFGMAVLAASSGSTLTDAAKAMVRPGQSIEPTQDFAEIYGEGYRTLLLELEHRGWLPGEIARFSLAKISGTSDGAA